MLGLQVKRVRENKLIKNYFSKTPRNKNTFEDNIKLDFTETWVQNVDCNLLVWDRILRWKSVKMILKNLFS